MASIGGHGNGTWGRTRRSTLIERKRSYNIKLEKKAKLLSLTKGKKFCLLSNVRDPSNIKNYIAYSLGEKVNIPYSVGLEFVSLYLNGHYNGLYLLTNKVQLGKSNIDIPQMDKDDRIEELWQDGFKGSVDSDGGYAIDNAGAVKGGAKYSSNEDVSGGYLLDHCNHGFMLNEAPSGFISKNGILIKIKEPKYAAPQEVEYIKNYYDETDVAVASSTGFNLTTGRHYSEYIDVESFVKYYIMQELLGNTDGGRGSFFMYKKPDELGGKLYAGPLWDFDNSLSYNEELFYIKSGFANHPNDYAGFLSELCKHDDFIKSVYSTYESDIYPVVQEFVSDSVFCSLCAFVTKETFFDNLRWPVGNREKVDEVVGRLNSRAEFRYHEWVERGVNKYSVFVNSGMNLSTSYYIYEYRIPVDSTYILPMLTDNNQHKYEFSGWIDNYNKPVTTITNEQDSILVVGTWRKSFKPTVQYYFEKIKRLF